MSESPRTDSPIEPTREPPATKPENAPTPLEPGDFYYENGLMVFTA